MMEADNQSDVWDKKFLETLLYSNSDRLAIKTNDKGKNPFIWSQFQIAYIDGIEQKYACCKFCKTFIKYSGRTGTGGLMRHLCFKKHNALKLPKRRRPRPEQSDQKDMTFAKNAWARLRLEDLVHRNSSRIGYVRNTKGKSDIWTQFRILSVDNILSKFACCMSCRSIVTYTSRTGTGSMMRHRCHSNKHRERLEFDEEVPEQVPVVGVDLKSKDVSDWEDAKESCERRSADSRWIVPEMVEDESPLKMEKCESGVPTEAATVLHQKHAALLNKSLRLFDIFENQEFLELAQFLVNLGARYGPVDVKDIFKRKTNLDTLDDN